jgi:hypothetical protein
VAKFAGFCFISDTPRKLAIRALGGDFGGVDEDIRLELHAAMFRVLI